MLPLFTLFIILNYSLSLIVFPFKVRENDRITYESPINKTKIPILKYLNHILNDYEFISEIDVGIPKQKVELKLEFDTNYLSILPHATSAHPYFYNLSSSYKELMVNDRKCGLRVANHHTINEILHMKNEFHDNLKDFLNSKSETSHEFVIIFSKDLPTLKPIVQYKYHDSNEVEIGLLVNTIYNNEHGIYKPFLLEMQEKGYIEKALHFVHFFDEYEYNIYNYNTSSDAIFDGLVVFGKYPHELLPNKYDIKQLYWTDTFLRILKKEYWHYENILWGIKFNEVYIDYGNNKKTKFEYLRGEFDLNVETIFPPYEYYETIKNFFRPLRPICFIDSNSRLFKSDPNIYRMVYCDYEEFGKKYIKTFPKLVFRLENFDTEFEFTYKDLFKPVYDNKYYLFLIFTGRFYRASELVIQPPSYPWTLGRLFFKKYQFVFDALNKKVGYYNVKNEVKNEKEDIIENVENKEPNKEPDKEPNKEPDKETNKEPKKDDNIEAIKETDKQQEKEIINKNKDEKNNNQKDNKETNPPKNIQKNDLNISTNLLYIICGIVIFILVVGISVCLYCKRSVNKNKKKEENGEELIDVEPEDNKDEQNNNNK